MSTELVHMPEVEVQAEVRSRFMPALRVQDAIDRRNTIVSFMRQAMIEGTDYGVIPGSNRPVLLKPGAEKTSTLFGLSPEFSTVESIEDWDGAAHGGEPFFYYRLKCRLRRGDVVIGEGEGSCNSRESKYRYRWVPEDDVPIADRPKHKKRGGVISEFPFAVDKGETTGQYGKPQGYWERWREAIGSGSAWKAERPTKKGKMMAWYMNVTEYRVPNPEIADLVNTFLKMAAKRAHVAAALNLGLSDLFTQDLEDQGTPEPPDAPTGFSAPTEGIPEAPPHPDDAPQALPATAEPLTEPPKKRGNKLTAFQLRIVEQFEPMKKQIGDAAYYRILGAHGFEKCIYIPDETKASLILAEMQAEF